MKPILLFDLGNTLVEYYPLSEFPQILRKSIQQVKKIVQEAGLSVPSDEAVVRRVREENYEANNYRVRPLEKRLMRIFKLDMHSDSEIMTAICRAFLAPIFSIAKPYPDTHPALTLYRERGHPIGILSNCPWGSPSSLWQEELERHGLLNLCDLAVFCSQVGWQKLAQPIFRFAINHFSCHPQDCLFIGDHPKWDVWGARRAGMFSVLLDRTKKNINKKGELCIYSLWDLEGILSARKMSI